MPSIVIRDDELRLEQAVRRLLPDGGTRIVGIDGCDGVGNSTLAGALACRLGVELVSIDDYVARKTGKYVAAVDYQRLLSYVVTGLRSRRLLVVEGVCLLDVLTRIECEASVLIYVQAVSRSGLPRNMLIVDDEFSLEEALDELRAGEETLGEQLGSATLDRELARYHKRIHPRQQADVIYERTEDGS